MEKYLDEKNLKIQQISKKYNTLSSIHKDDLIYQFLINNPVFKNEELAIDYYFRDGRNSAHILFDVIKELLIIKPDRVKLLEFASGYGCLTRHLLDNNMSFDITSCDIHAEAISFIEDKLGGKGLLSSRLPENFNAEANSYDVVFCLSFFSHMPDRTWFPWLNTLYNVVKSDGLLIFTTHGYQSIKHFGVPSPKLDRNGYWFKPDSEQTDLDVHDYGSTIVSPSYVCERIKLLTGNPILLRVSEGFWWKHQDLYIVQKG